MNKIKACIINVTSSQMYSEKVEGNLKFKSVLEANMAIFVRNMDTGQIAFARSICYLAMPKQQGQLKADHKFTFDLDHGIEYEITERDTGEIGDTKVSHTFQMIRPYTPIKVNWKTHKQFARPRDPFKYKGVTTQRYSVSGHGLGNIPKCLEIPSD